jgi:putative FmdB family regulatory protein
MPIYEYKCLSCGHDFEYLILPSSPAPHCPVCQREDLQRLISLCAVSSETTQQAHLKAARKKARQVHRDKEYEEHKQAHRMEDH